MAMLNNKRVTNKLELIGDKITVSQWGNNWAVKDVFFQILHEAIFFGLV